MELTVVQVVGAALLALVLMVVPVIHQPQPLHQIQQRFKVALAVVVQDQISMALAAVEQTLVVAPEALEPPILAQVVTVFKARHTHLLMVPLALVVRLLPDTFLAVVAVLTVVLVARAAQVVMVVAVLEVLQTERLVQQVR